jgi:predicted amidophosphoribosyltransferase
VTRLKAGFLYRPATMACTTTISVTISQAASKDSGTSRRSRPATKLCEKCQGISVFVNTHCRKCRKEMAKNRLENPCPMCRKREVNPEYVYCFPCHKKRDEAKTKTRAGYATRICPEFTRCFSCHTSRSSSTRGSSSGTFPFIIKITCSSDEQN